MQITPQEISDVEDAGILDNSPVKLIRTKGGFWIAIGKPKGKFRDEALAAGSHPAIVKFNLEKQYPGFQPIMLKSENFIDNTIVEKHSHFLSEDLRKSGYDIYSVQKDNNVNFHITQNDFEVATVNGSLEREHLLIKSLNIPKEFAAAMAASTVEKAVECQVGMKIKK